MEEKKLETDKSTPWGRRFEDDDCPLGGDVKDDCAGCIYSGEYHYDKKTGECVKRTKKVED